jgi:hypothetical protein
MKKFTIRAFTFTIPIVLFMLPIDFSISYLLGKKNKFAAGELEIWKDIYSSNIDCDIAIMGSSRAWVQINPQILKDSLDKAVYNFGIDGHNFRIQYLRHAEYLKYNKNPEQIIVSVDEFSFQKKNELVNYQQFLPYMLWNEDIYKYTISYKGFNKIDYYIPLVRYFGETTSIIHSISVLLNINNHEKLRNKGFKGMDRQWNSDFENAKEEFNQYKIVLDKESIQLFKCFVEECRKNEIDLTLVYTPLYIEGQQFVSNRDEIINIIEGMANDYNIAFYNYSNDSICFNKSLFYNAGHLNKKGAALFSQKLAHDLMKH